ncbi:hypothetical protein DO97_01255 [Neosynechococcus sphagnicola sy1]|uniref:D-alanyl-D-alanine carboxypeptidase-like core domain-containing protein n=1 Tax=Neosynechococcus sphagnicola sy1 TaxID=1497020 RepID=A0A098TQZ1_9CYAN|nr:hypothetical protein DO97_01255 [Neosynechococcus sphagnicola sy1]
MSGKLPPKPLQDDIPEALRITPSAGSSPRKSSRLRWAVILLGLGAIAPLSLWGFLQVLRPANLASSANSATPQPSISGQPADQVLGHFAYAEAPHSELAPIVADGSLKLRRAAARAFQQMVAAAQADGVSLVPISGFRTIADQNYLFFKVKEEREQTTAKRAEVSAPPGYSEHHTGYAVDIGDGTVPATNLNRDFENTHAFQWLQVHAAGFSFELSFPQGNPQGVSYEPWHWRFVGDRASLETFYKARGHTAQP